MVAEKIDERAVRAELSQIFALMTEICRQLGPQTWEGGAAADFITDLRGHNGSLHTMMGDIMEAVIRINHVPSPVDVPAKPQIAAPSGRPGVASVSTSRLERLELALRAAGRGLSAHARRIQQIFSAAGPYDAGTAQCGRTSAWCAQEAGRTRTRIHYALASDQVDPSFVLHRGMTRIPDKEVFGRSEMKRLGELQAQAYAWHLRNPNANTRKVMADIGGSLRENAGNRAYLNAFFGNVPPGSAGTLAYFLHRRPEHGPGLDGADKKIVGDFGTGLAALSRAKNGEAAVRRALGPMGSDMPGQALLVKLSAPNVKWGSHVLADLAKAALRWHVKHPSYTVSGSGTIAGEPHTSARSRPEGWWNADWGIKGNDGTMLRQYEPALNILGRIRSQGDNAAARELASTDLDKAFSVAQPDKAKPITWIARGNGDTYASLLVSPDWLDKGATAGAVIRLATTPREGHETESAEIAAEVMKSVAWWNESGREKVDKFLDHTKMTGDHESSKQYGLELGSGLRAELFTMTRMYIPAIGAANRTSSGTDLPEVDNATGQTYVDISGTDMQNYLRTFAADDKQWAQLAIDTQRYRQHLNAWAMRNLSIPHAITRGGYMEGNIIAAYAKERIGREEITKKEYEDIKADLTAIRDVAGAILEQIPIGQNAFVGYSYEQGTTLALDQVKYADFEKKVEEIKSKGATYSDQLFIDLARGYEQAHPTPARIKQLLEQPSLDEDQKRTIIKWIKREQIIPGSVHNNINTQVGDDIVRETESAVDHNYPPPSD